MQAPPGQPQGTLLICPRHGLRYDPRRSTGCIRCRRTTDEVADPRAAPMATFALLVAGAVAVGAGISAYRAYRRPDEPPSPITGASPTQRRCLGASAGDLSKVIDDCRKGCAEGGGPSCRRLAGLCSPGSEVVVSDSCGPGPAGLLSRACQTGDLVACGLRADTDRSLALRTACDGGVGSACRELVALCDRQRPALGDGAPTTAWAFFGPLRDTCAETTAQLLGRGCAQGDWRSCDTSGIREGLPPGRLTSVLDAACDRRDAAACRRLAGEMTGEPGAASALVAQAAAIEACTSADCPVGRWRDRLDRDRAKTEQGNAAAGEQGCAQGLVASCWQASEAYATGEGVSRDDQRAAAFGARARELLTTGCNQPGGTCASPGALRMLEACDRGEGAACVSAAQIERGGMPGDSGVLLRRARRLLRTGCDARRGPDCWSLAEMQRQNVAPSSDDQLTALLREGCDARDGLSCHSLGQRLTDGRGAPADRNSAERAFRQAADLLPSSCDSGARPACQALAQILRDGRGVPRDEARAATIDARAAALEPSAAPSAAPSATGAGAAGGRS